MSRLPIITALLCTFACSLMLLPSTVHDVLYFDYQRLMTGNGLGLLSGHWMHADADHLIWNVSALALLSALIEAQSRRLLLWSLLIGMVSVDLLLVSPLSDVARYCGLSGVLNTLLGVALFLHWRRTQSRLVIGVGLLCVLKIMVELLTSQSLFTTISWPPFALAHLAGILGTPIALLLGYSDTRGNCATQHDTRTTYEHLVPSE